MGEALREYLKNKRGIKMEKDKVKVNEQLEKYKCFPEQMRYEGEFLWRIFGAFLLPQSIFLAFLLSVGFGDEKLTRWSPGVFIAAIVGLLLCIAWMLICLGSIAYYHFSVAQVKGIEPKDWELMKGRREEFRDGRSVKIEGRWYQIKCFLKIRVRYAIYVIIVAFFMTYLLIFILRGPWMG